MNEDLSLVHRPWTAAKAISPLLPTDQRLSERDKQYRSLACMLLAWILLVPGLPEYTARPLSHLPVTPPALQGEGRHQEIRQDQYY